ncbi:MULTISPECIES: tyrosine-type recombinase/integrase [Lacrimispora]|jgi:integrase|uniref:tyrosine-type recombinase/integrase n=1 Tax=Lacrimispora TaxID=2719231 RepID=UPI00045EC3B1|nr:MULTISPECIES: tyrosine-type recombinase/integrase [Lacrimispora]
MCRSVSPYKKQNEIIVRILTSNPSAPLAELNDTISELQKQIFYPDGKLTTAACQAILEFNQKESQVKEVCDLRKIKLRPDDSRIYLIIKRKPISSTNYIGLVEKLYDHLFSTNAITMKEYFETWMQWRSSESSVTEKTIKENRFLWNALLKDQEITKVPLNSLSVKDYIRYFRIITKDRQLTRKRFNDLKSIMNGILYLAVENEVIDHNCLRDINFKQFAFKAEENNIKPYTEEERLQIINHLGDDFYDLAIKLDFHLVLRIGELKGLKWEDVKGDTIFIRRFIDDQNKVIEDIKGHTSQGKRQMPLTPNAQKILEQIRHQNPGSEYIFIRNGQPLATVTFNRHLKKCCEELGIEYRSSHKLRFSTASIMYKNGMEDTELQKLLGHTSLNMTHHYLRSLTSQEDTASKMRAILG